MEGDLNSYKHNLGFEAQDAVGVLEQLSTSLLSLYRLGICHRDIKPANIMFKERDNCFVFKVGDYEAAELSNTVCKTKSKTSGQLHTVYTPNYAEPDVLKPRAQEGSGPTREEMCSDDIFSLAVSIFELLFGRLPFDPLTMKSDDFHDAKFDLESFYALDPEQRAAVQE